jgi:hypothetical protein
MSAVLKSKQVKERVSKEEWICASTLAAAYQLAAIFKWTDLITPTSRRACPATTNSSSTPTA